MSFLSLNAAGTLIAYGYDADGNLPTLTSEERKLKSYDALGRLITEVQQNSGGTPILTTVNTYAPYGNVQSETGTGNQAFD